MVVVEVPSVVDDTWDRAWPCASLTELTVAELGVTVKAIRMRSPVAGWVEKEQVNEAEVLVEPATSWTRATCLPTVKVAEAVFALASVAVTV